MDSKVKSAVASFSAVAPPLQLSLCRNSPDLKYSISHFQKSFSSLDVGGVSKGADPYRAGGGR